MFTLTSDLGQSRKVAEDQLERTLRRVNRKLAQAVEARQEKEIQDSYSTRVAVDNIVLRESEPGAQVVRMPGENDTGYAVIDELRFDEEGQIRQALRVRVIINPSDLLSGRDLRRLQKRGIQRALQAKHQYVGEFTVRSLLLFPDYFEVKIGDTNPKVQHLQPGVYQRGTRETGGRAGGRGNYLIMHLAYLPKTATLYSRLRTLPAAASRYQYRQAGRGVAAVCLIVLKVSRFGFND